jgi:putative flippase GtrA
MKIFIQLFSQLKNFGSRRYPRLYQKLWRHKSIVKFFISGPVAGAVDLLVLFVLHGLCHVSVIWATSIAYILSFGVSFYLQKFWTFCNYNRRHVYRQLILYFLFAFINLNINGYLMHILVNRFQVWYLLAQIIVSLIISLDSFLVYKFIVFRHRHGDEVLS